MLKLSASSLSLALTLAGIASSLAFSPSNGFVPSLRTSGFSHASVAGKRALAANVAIRSEQRRMSGKATSLNMGLLDALKNLAMPTEIAQTANQAPAVPAAEGTLTWEVGVSEIADPRHAMEDAWFVDEFEIGVFDGVSGARKSENMDELYSFILCATTQRMLRNQRNKRKAISVDFALEFAVGALTDTMSVGASTACVTHIDTSVPGYTTLKGCNVGDSGLTVVRRNPEDGKLYVAFKTNPQMHYFNCPFQLGGTSPDQPDQATKFTCPLQSGDILVIGSDGLYDNVYDSQILDLIEYTKDQDATSMAQVLVGYARQQQENSNILVPYGVEAQAAGQAWVGGKLDDTCVIVAKFT